MNEKDNGNDYSEPLQEVAQALAGLLGTKMKSFMIEQTALSINITVVTHTQPKQKTFQNAHT